MDLRRRLRDVLIPAAPRSLRMVRAWVVRFRTNGAHTNCEGQRTLASRRPTTKPPTPKGFRTKAQGCESPSYPGAQNNRLRTPTGFRPIPSETAAADVIVPASPTGIAPDDFQTTLTGFDTIAKGARNELTLERTPEVTKQP